MRCQELRLDIIRTALKAQQAGLIRGTMGNISARSGDGEIVAITPSGMEYGCLTPEDIPLLDLDGNRVEGGTSPSSEWMMHLILHRELPHCGAVIHTHSRFATVCAMGGEPLGAVTIPQVAHSLAPLPVVPFALPGSLELAQGVRDALAEGSRGALLRHHGLVVVGRDLQEAYAAAEYAEEAAEIACYAAMMGQLSTIPDHMVQQMREIAASGRSL